MSAKSDFSPASMERTTMAVSFTRVRGFSSAMPLKRSMIAWLDEPKPSTNRPGSSWPSTSAVAANTAGVRV